MAQFERQQVFQSMSRSPNACLHALAELGNGMAVARWSNAHDARDYQAVEKRRRGSQCKAKIGEKRSESRSTLRAVNEHFDRTRARACF